LQHIRRHKTAETSNQGQFEDFKLTTIQIFQPNQTPASVSHIQLQPIPPQIWFDIKRDEKGTRKLGDIKENEKANRVKGIM